MRKLAAQKPAFRDSETVIIQLLAAGEFPFGMVYSHQAASLKKRGAPVDWVRTAQPIVTGLKPIALAPRRNIRTPANYSSMSRCRKKARN